MRHKVYGKKLSRNKKLRERLFKSLCVNFLIHGKMTTTLAKAKAVVSDIEKMVTKAKIGSQFSRRLLLQKLNHTVAVAKVIAAGKAFKDQNGGYTRLLKLPNRTGDNSRQAIILWSKEFNQTPLKAQLKEVTGEIKPAAAVKDKKTAKKK